LSEIAIDIGKVGLTDLDNVIADRFS